MFAGLRKPTKVIVMVVTRLSYGCPVQGMVPAFGLDERTVAWWRDRAGAHCQQVHQALVEPGKLDLMHVQADEIRVKGRGMIAWRGLCDDGLDPLMAGWDRESDTGHSTGGSADAASARLCADGSSHAGLH